LRECGGDRFNVFDVLGWALEAACDRDEVLGAV
jgi:hypothetical protein